MDNQIGILNRDYGYNGFEIIKSGTPVYEAEDKYYFYMTMLSSGEKIKQSFYKQTLKPDIKFIQQKINANNTYIDNLVRRYNGNN